MIVSCDNCKAQYRLDPAKLSARGARVNCRRCKHVFVIYKDSEEETPSEAPSEAPSASASAGVDVDSLDFRKVGIQAWRVKVKIGLVYDFSDYRTLAKYIQEGRVEPSDLLSHDGHNWCPLNEIGDLAGHFVEIYRKAETGELDLGTPETTAEVSREETFASVDTGVQGLDMEVESDELTGPSMSDLVASAMEEVDDDVTAVMPHPTKAGEGSPRFVDPFEALRARQKAQGEGGGSSTGRRQKGEDGQGSGPPKVLLVLVGLAIVGLLGVLFAPEGVDPNAVADREKLQEEQKIKRSEIDAARKAKGKREKLNRELAALAQEVTDEDSSFMPGLSPDEQLVPVIPPEFRDGAVAKKASPSSGMGVGGEAVAQAQRAMSIGDWDAAAAAWRSALMSGNAPVHREQLGVALYKGGQQVAAALELNRAAGSGVVSAHRWLGHLARDQGDVAGAMSHYNTYLRTNPPDRDRILVEIARLGGG
jgi:predicted Zn finger-like uncharacterized protein